MMLRVLMSALLWTTPASGPVEGADSARFADAYYLDTCADCAGRLGARGETAERHYADRELRFCHRDCQGRFEENFSAGLERLDERLVADQLPFYPSAVSAVSGKPLGDDAVDVIWGNRLFRLASEAERRALLDDPVRYIRALDRAVIEAQRPGYGMPDKCPVQGDIFESDTPIDVVIANRMVRLCCARCVKIVKARPSQYLGMVEYANRAARRAAGGSR
jgi:hypothetical protein